MYRHGEQSAAIHFELKWTDGDDRRLDLCTFAGDEIEKLRRPILSLLFIYVSIKIAINRALAIGRSRCSPVIRRQTETSRRLTSNALIDTRVA